jgi:hypothetical protein
LGTLKASSSFNEEWYQFEDGNKKYSRRQAVRQEIKNPNDVLAISLLKQKLLE